MPTTNELVIKPDGKTFRRRVTEDEINIADSVIAELSDDVTLRLSNVLNHPTYGHIGLAVTKNTTYATLKLDSIPLRTTYRITDDKIVVPTFSTDETQPVFPLSWKIPSNMIVYLLVCLTRSTLWGAKAFMFATNDRERWWRLPMGNIYETCQMCLGNVGGAPFNGRSPTLMETVDLIAGQFNNSQWNSDLHDSEEKTQHFFRFKPENDTYEQLPPSQADWTLLCQKVVVDETNYIVA